MIDILIHGIVGNTNKIESIAKYVKNMNKRNTIQVILILATIYTVTKVVSNHEERINCVEKKLEDINKGE